jgi:hypothetical protein
MRLATIAADHRFMFVVSAVSTRGTERVA